MIGRIYGFAPPFEVYIGSDSKGITCWHAALSNISITDDLLKFTFIYDSVFFYVSLHKINSFSCNGRWSASDGDSGKCNCFAYRNNAHYLFKGEWVEKNQPLYTMIIEIT